MTDAQASLIQDRITDHYLGLVRIEPTDDTGKAFILKVGGKDVAILDRDGVRAVRFEAEVALMDTDPSFGPSEEADELTRQCRKVTRLRQVGDDWRDLAYRMLNVIESGEITETSRHGPANTVPLPIFEKWKGRAFHLSQRDALQEDPL